MRLKSIAIEGFRAFGKRVEIDLDADMIILHGPNGAGKTSLLDAILWVLTGVIDRFADRGSPVSLYSREGIARVQLVLASGPSTIIVTRTSDGEKGNVRFRIGDVEIEGPAAEQRLCNELLPHLKDRQEAGPALTNVLTRAVYLQQDLVRQFIDSDTATERFALVSEVIGAGIVLELQQTLEKSRNQWSRSTSALRKDQLEPLRARLGQVDDQLSRLAGEAALESLDARRASEDLFNGAVSLIGQVRLSSTDPPTTPTLLDRLLKDLSAERARLERELSTAAALEEQASVLADPEPAGRESLAQLSSAEDALRSELEATDRQIQEALSTIAAERDRQVAAADRASRAATLAKIAMEDLGPICPVCEQSHDIDKTIRHLNELIAASTQPLPPILQQAELEKLNGVRGNIQKRMETARAQRNDAVQRQREWETRRELVLTRLRDFGMNEVSDLRTQLASRQVAARETLAALGGLVSEGEQLALSVVRLSELRRRDELQAERGALSTKIDDLTEQVDKQERTHALAGRIIEELRDASLNVTRRQIEQIAPIFQRIYSRIDPHPTFRVTQMLAKMERGRGQLSIGVYDPNKGSDSYDPGPILSSSQLNSFAVSLFLAMNLALPSLKLSVTMLDDPLQSLDSINLLGLVDVLRRFRSHRQIIVSTHETRLLGLLQRKLRPVRANERMLTMVFGDWTPEGPVVRITQTDHSGEEQNVLAA